MNNNKEPDEIRILDNCISMGRGIDHIRELSQALNRVGLRELGEELYELHCVMSNINEDTRTSINQVISNQVTQATENTNAMFGAALATLSQRDQTC